MVNENLPGGAAVSYAMSATAEKEKAVTAETVKRLDAERSALERLPPAEELFPAMLPERAAWYRKQLAIMAIAEFTGPQESFWWDELLGPRDRIFVCRLARLERVIAGQKWRALQPGERCRLMCAFMWIHDWVKQFVPPLDPIRDLAIRGDL